MQQRLRRKLRSIIGRYKCRCQPNPLQDYGKNVVTLFHDFEGGYSGNGRQEPCLNAVEHILAAEEKFGIKGTYNTVAKFAYDIPELMKRITKGGHEIASHSFDHRLLVGVDIKQKANNILQTKISFQDMGIQIIGHRSPQSLWNYELMGILLQHNFLWSAENGNEPYPYICARNAEQNLWRFPVRADDWNYIENDFTPDQMLEFWKNIVSEGCQRRQFTAIGIHPWVQDNPGRLKVFKQFLAWLSSRNDVETLTFGQALELIKKQL